MIRNLILIALLIFVGFFLWNFMVGDSPDDYEKYGNCQIQKIVNNPYEMNGKIVTVTGEVTSSTNIGITFYRVDDGTGVMGVKSAGPSPTEEKIIRVTGVVHQYMKIGDKQILAIQERESKMLE